MGSPPASLDLTLSDPERSISRSPRFQSLLRPSYLLWCVVITNLKQIRIIYNVHVHGVSTVFLSRSFLVVNSNINRQLGVWQIDFNKKKCPAGLSTYIIKVDCISAHLHTSGIKMISEWQYDIIKRDLLCGKKLYLPLTLMGQKTCIGNWHHAVCPKTDDSENKTKESNIFFRPVLAPVVTTIIAVIVSEWVISKFNGTSTPKGSYSAKIRCKTVLWV